VASATETNPARPDQASQGSLVLRDLRVNAPGCYLYLPRYPIE